MVQQKQTDGIAETLKAKALRREIIVGKESVLKAMRQAALERVFLAQNAPPRLKDDLQHYSGLTGIPVQQLPYTNEELGILCKKNFRILVVGLKNP